MWRRVRSRIARYETCTSLARRRMPRAPPFCCTVTIEAHGHSIPRSIRASCLPMVIRRNRKTIVGCTPICGGSRKDTGVRMAAQPYRSTSKDSHDVSWSWSGLERPCGVPRSGRSGVIRTRGASGGLGCVVTASPPTGGLPFSPCSGRSLRMGSYFNTSTLTACQRECLIELLRSRST